MGRVTRRNVIEGAAAICAGAALPAIAAQPGAPAGRAMLWYGQPASVWTEALPIGNGRLGAMVFGGTGHERLQLNEDTLWSGAPYDPVNADAKAALPEVRRLSLRGAIRRRRNSATPR